MVFTGGKKLALFATLLLLGMQSAFAAMVTYRIHIYSPWKDDPTRNAASTAKIVMDGSGGPIGYHGPAMVSEGGDWYYQDVTFNDGPPGTGDGYRNFHITSYIPNGTDPWANQAIYNNAGKDFTLDDVFFKTGFKNNVWIIPNGLTGVPKITDVPPNTKVVYLFNPWPALGAPVIKTDKADWTQMRFPENKSRCGWYVFYMQNGDTKVQFRNLQGGQLYGAAGLNDAAPYDIASQIAADDKDTVFLVPSNSPAVGGPARIYTEFPTGTLGVCKFDLAVTIRDFSAAHPDFEVDNRAEDAIKGTKGMILPTLDPTTKKPVKNPASAYKYSTRFQDWFATTPATEPAATRNYESCYDLPISKSMDGYWQYSSLDEFTTGFFPLGLNKDSKFPTDPNHTNCYTTDIDVKSCMGGPADKPGAVDNMNFNFCMEMHANFKYEKGQKFNFIGDDDVWVFINNKLVIDIGGAHWPIKDSVSLDTITGISAGQKYDFDLFYCERQFSGSNLLIKTSIYFEQKQSIEAVQIPGSNPPAWDIKENTCGDKSCGAVLTNDTCKIIPGISTYALSGGSLTAPETLTGSSHGGGIIVDGSKTKITIDTSKITDLAPGLYRVTYTSEKSKRAGFIEFEIIGSWVVDFVTKTGPDALVKTPVEATVRATLNGKPDLSGQGFTLTPAAGLTVYEDAAMTKPIAAGTEIKTDATGTKKVYVTATAKGPYTLTVKGTKAKGGDTFTANFFEIVKAATPTANPASKSFPVLPLPVALASATVGATILYTIDGTDPDSAGGGTTKTFAGSVDLNGSTTLKAIAIKAGYYKSDIMTEKYVYTRPATVKQAYYKDLNGDGRIETVIVDYDEDLVTVPEKLTFKVGAPTDQELTARNDQKEIAFAAGSKSRIVVTFSKPFPFGVTSVADPANSGHQFSQADIPLLDGAFPVDDSVPPVIVSAVVKAPDSTLPFVRVVLTLSETGPFNLASQTAILFKRDGDEMAAADVKVRGIKAVGDKVYEMEIDSTSLKFPIKGDSAAINTNGEIADAKGNKPSIKHFIELGGEAPKGKSALVYITFANGTKIPVKGMADNEPTSPPDVIFIPFDKAGVALNGDRSEGKCAGCFVGSEGKFVGTVVYMEIPGPVEYEFKIFSNFGSFVAGGKGKITDKDLPSLQTIHNGTAYLARIVWTGRTGLGDKAGTGAYVIVSTVKTQKNFKTGALPATNTDRIRFGLLRSYRGS